MLEELRKNYNNLKLSLRRLGITVLILSPVLALVMGIIANLDCFNKKIFNADSSAKTIKKVKNAKAPPVQELLAQNSQMKMAIDKYRANVQAQRQITISRAGKRGSGLTMGDALTTEQIEAFLKKYRSPMAPYAQNIADASRRYNVNPALVIAIAGVESTFGQHAPGYNAWGWGHMRWSSWPEAIETYTKDLSEKYLKSWRCQTIEDINRRYCPNPSWSSQVKYFYNQALNS